LRAVGAASGRLLHRDDQHHDAGNGRDHGAPEHQPEVSAAREHEAGRGERPDDRADGKEGNAQAESRASRPRRKLVGQQRIARRIADALARAIQEARGKHGRHVAGEGEQRLRERRQAIAENDQRLAPPLPVRERPGEHPHERVRGFRDALDEPHRRGRGAEGDDEKQREEAVDHLRGGAHQQAHRAERDHVAWQRLPQVPRRNADAPRLDAPDLHCPPDPRHPCEQPRTRSSLAIDLDQSPCALADLDCPEISGQAVRAAPSRARTAHISWNRTPVFRQALGRRPAGQPHDPDRRCHRGVGLEVRVVIAPDYVATRPPIIRIE
jgi:hypothetical protein